MRNTYKMLSGKLKGRNHTKNPDIEEEYHLLGYEAV
jgi:hypothetical protein